MTVRGGPQWKVVGISKSSYFLILRHLLATHPVVQGGYFRDIQELLRRSDAKAAIVYAYWPKCRLCGDASLNVSSWHSELVA
jgi:site-specific recombinase XerD